MLNSKTHIEIHFGQLDADFSQQLHQLLTQGATLMSKLQEFAMKQQAYNERMNVALEGIRGDLKNQDEKIKKLQDSAANNNELSDEDKDILNQLEMASQELADKLDQIDQLNAPELPEENEEEADDAKNEDNNEDKLEDNVNNENSKENDELSEEEKKNPSGVATADTKMK